MGYMGFGMQKWIYTQRPKKGFSKEKKIYGDHLDKLSKGESLTDNKTLSESAREDLISEVLKANMYERRRRIMLFIFSFVSAVLVCYGLAQIIKNYLL